MIFQEYTVHKISSKIIVLHVLIFMFLDSQPEYKKILNEMVAGISHSVFYDPNHRIHQTVLSSLFI